MQALESTYAKVFNAAVDVVFVLDIFLTFRTTYNSFGQEIWTPKKIASNYIKGTFILDLVSVIPFDEISRVFVSIFAFNPDNLQIAKLFKLFRLLRISKVIVYLKVKTDVKAVSDLIDLALLF